MDKAFSILGLKSEYDFGKGGQYKHVDQPAPKAKPLPLEKTDGDRLAATIGEF